MLQILTYLKPRLRQMMLGLTIKFTGSIMDLCIPWILAYMIDHVVPMKQMSRIVLWGFIMILCAIIAVTNNIIANRMASRVARDSIREIRHDLFTKISYLSCKQVDEISIPSLVSRLTTDTYHVHQMLGMMQRMGVRAPILLIGGILITLTLDPVLTLVLIAVLPFIAYVVYSISRKGIPLFREVQRGVDDMIRIVRESASGIRVIKALSKVDYEKVHFDKANAEVVRREKKASLTMAISNPAMNFFLNVGLTLAIIVGGYRVNLGVSEPGKIIAFLSYFTIILNAMLAVTRIFTMVSRASASSDRICYVLNQPEDLILEKLREDAKAEDEDAHVVFDHVNFAYQKGGANNLTDISFCLKKGETLGIIGETGCGKSTLIQLLMRFYDVDSGEIRIGGRKVTTIPPEELHTKFGITFQNDILFADTIRENIAFGRTLSEEELEKAADNAQAMEFINSLSDRFDHRLTAKGTNLSGGQKQRVLISRALAKKPEILILDDASSALDYRTDANLRKAIYQEFEDTTTIIVAQRISSIMHADHILVLEQGKMLGYGTHEELMETCESYREISRTQMGGGRS